MDIILKSFKVMKNYKLPTMAGVLLIVIIFLAIFAPWIAPYGQYEYNYKESYQPPNKDHLLGTDQMGRDILTRVIFGARASLKVASLGVLIGTSLGIIIGVTAGFIGTWVETVLMRIVDVGLSFPLIMLAILIMGLFGKGGVLTLVVACGVSRAPRMARIAHAATKSVKERDYVLTARSLGSSSMQTMMRHILPNINAPVLVHFTLDFSIIILIEASLSFLGLGIPPPTPSWGRLISTGREVLRRAPWISLSGGGAIFCTILSINILGDGLRDFLDPRISVH